MKRLALYIGLTAALVASCSTQEKDFQTHLQDDVVFYASFEQPVDEGTRVYANEGLLLRWTADDRISIFNKNTYNQQYRFAGETGDNAGGFDKVAGSEFATGNAISHVVSVYPYQSTTKISESESLTLTLPAEQHYAENSFGLGANTMVSVTADNFLQYKTVGGYLVLKLYGDGISVSSITLKGNNGEKLAGKATVTMPEDGAPTVSMADDATDAITLVCDSPVQLGVTAEESALFWFVVPAVTFSKGFTVSVSGSTGGVFEKTTSKSITIERNKLSRMSSIEVDEVIPTGNIVFADDKVKQKLVAAFDTNGDGELSFYEAAAVTSGEDLKAAFGAIKTYKSFDEFRYFTGITLIPNSMFYGWKSLMSIIIPDNVTTIGEHAFSGCVNLSSIVLPDRVTSIDSYAFQKCSSLTGIVIPESMTTIGSYCFSYCSSLTSIIIPESVTRLERGAFCDCSSLKSIILPNSVMSIETRTFQGCSSLTSIVIPESVISIGGDAFQGCSSLTDIVIPESVTSIGSYAFQGCSSLISIIIPEGVSSIASDTFEGCSNLSSISIPKSVTRIGSFAFRDCSSLTSIIIPEGVTIIDLCTFYGCSSLSEIIIPESVGTIDRYAFKGCSSLKSIIIPESVTSIGSYAFQGCFSLISIIIPESMIVIGSYAFQECSSLTSIIVKSETPPIGSNGMFIDTNNAPIYVPSESIDDYKSAQYWCDYADRVYAIGTPMAVDMGLSVKWASFNLGATIPEEYGDYYAWGETEPYYNSQGPLLWKEGKENGYDCASYKWFKGDEDNYKLTKYCPADRTNIWDGEETPDGKTVLELEDDAARAIWGGTWRMPTDAEWAELRENCTWEWTTMNGVSGKLVTASNGSCIFLPAAGQWSGTDLYGVGSGGDYWSSSLDLGRPYYAKFVYVDFVDFGNYLLQRYSGLSVRPVYVE